MSHLLGLCGIYGVLQILEPLVLVNSGIGACGQPTRTDWVVLQSIFPQSSPPFAPDCHDFPMALKLMHLCIYCMFFGKKTFRPAGAPFRTRTSDCSPSKSLPINKAWCGLSSLNKLKKRSLA